MVTARRAGYDSIPGFLASCSDLELAALVDTAPTRRWVWAVVRAARPPLMAAEHADIEGVVAAFEGAVRRRGTRGAPRPGLTEADKRTGRVGDPTVYTGPCRSRLDKVPLTRFVGGIRRSQNSGRS
ncbi:hypothetical protein GCM10023322_55100 [Rugosimonospora acidiphila]|uniref:Uncharacterized protein n=1 Tax=Rugosimonospora acidiphila TaxID=556531 RepID=A0ABP9SAS8_9ACTN